MCRLKIHKFCKRHFSLIVNNLKLCKLSFIQVCKLWLVFSNNLLLIVCYPSCLGEGHWMKKKNEEYLLIAYLFFPQIRHLIHTQRMGAFGLSTTSSTTPDSSVLCSLQCDLYPSTVPLRLTQQWLEMPAWTLKTMIRKKRILHKFSSTGRWCSLKWCHNVVYITGTDWIGEIMLSGMDWIRKIVLIGMDWISG